MFEGNLIHVSHVPSKWLVSILSPSFVLYVRFGCCHSVAKSCPALCDPRDCSMPGSSVLHYDHRVCSNSCSLSQWCHPTILSSATLFSSCLQSFPASVSFQISQLFTSDGQSIGASTSVLPMNIQKWFPLGLTGVICLQSKGSQRVWHDLGTEQQQQSSVTGVLTRD